MALTQFHLETQWSSAAAPAAVWDALARSEAWPSWWRAVERVEVIEPGEPDGVGAYRRLAWRTARPYRIATVVSAPALHQDAFHQDMAQAPFPGRGKW